MAFSAHVTEAQRSLQRLVGILDGISTDYILDDREVAELHNWISRYEFLHPFEPFKSVVAMLRRCLADDIIDEDEREELLELCTRIAAHRFPDCVTTAVRRLHGYMHGLIIDGKLTDEEIRCFSDWLLDFDLFRGHWPICDAWRLVENILRDGVVSRAERAELFDFCSEFAETTVTDPQIHDAWKEPHVQIDKEPFQSFTALCDRSCEICFEDRRFCITGLARSGRRKEIFAQIAALGGIPCKNVVMDLDYLVIGAQSSPAWSYSTYGRKVEAVVDLRKRGHDIAILHEDDFVEQANMRAGGR